MTPYPPTGPHGEGPGPPPYLFPGEIPVKREDWPDAERRRRPRRPRRLITKFVLGVLLVLAIFAAVVCLVSGNGDLGAILGPDDGARLHPGTITFRVRVDPAERGPRWELEFTRTDGPEAWQQVGVGQSAARPNALGSGILFADITEPGPYLRLTVSDANGRRMQDTVEFTIAE
jgi:hypothetical protein